MPWMLPLSVATSSSVSLLRATTAKLHCLSLLSLEAGPPELSVPKTRLVVGMGCSCSHSPVPVT